MVNNTAGSAGSAAGKVQLPNLEGELLADTPRASNVSLRQAQLSLRVSFYVSYSAKLSTQDSDKCSPDGINHGDSY